MLTVRRAADRGRTSRASIVSQHSFSCGDYFDPAFIRFGCLLAINEDRVSPGKGFPAQAQRNVEIVSWVLSGALEYRDSLGNAEVARPGQVQRMTAGSGIRHSEYNASDATPLHRLQVWIEPEQCSLVPSYEKVEIFDQDSQDGFRLIGTRDGRDGSATIHQDIDLYGVRLRRGGRAAFEPRAGRLVWLQMARGRARLNGGPLEAGDGVAVEAEAVLDLDSETASEALLFDMAPMDE